VSIADIIARRRTNNKRYRFTIIGSLGSNVLEYAPDGFANGEMRLVRNKTYRGLFRSISISELVFYKDGKELLQYYYEEYGVDAEVLLKVEKYTSTGYVNWVSLKLDFAVYEINDVSVTVQAVDDSFVEKLKNREDQEVNLLSTTSVDGDTLPAMTVGLEFVDTSIDNNSAWTCNPTGTTYPLHHTIPVQVTAGGDFTEAISPAQIADDKAGALFYESEHVRILNWSGSVVGSIDAVGSQTDDLSYSLILKIYDVDNVMTYSKLLGHTTGNASISFNYTIDLQVTLNEGDSVVLQGEWTTSGDVADYTITYTNCTPAVNESYDGLIAGDVPAWGIYEAFKRTIGLITGVDDCLYSEKFGRTDLGYASDGTLLHIIKGKQLRTNVDSVPIKLKDLFTSVNAMYNIGLGYVNGKVRIEDVSYFYNDTVILDISYKVTNEIISKSVAPDLIYKDISAGYAKYGKKEVLSGFEFNTKASYTSEVKSVTTPLNIISLYRADGTSVVRLQHDDDLSKDVDGDNDLFFLKSTRNLGGNLWIETDEQFSSIQGTVYADKSINLDLTPARNIRRWGNVLTPGFIKSTGKLRWQNTDNNNNLVTQKTTETTAVTEAADIDYTSLEAPIYYAERYKLTVPLTNDEINTIFTNPNGLIRLSDTKAGWIDELIVNNDTNDVQMTLIRKYDEIEAAPYVLDQAGNKLLDQSGSYIKQQIYT